MEMENTAIAAGVASPAADPYLYPYDIKILVVEEDPSYLATITQMLQRYGYKVTGKASPEEGLRALRENPEGFDLVMSVAYTQGPGIDGFELLKQATERHPVILFADSAPRETVMRAIVGGVCDFLEKPLHHSKMCNIWQHVVRRNMNHEDFSDADDDGESIDDFFIPPDGMARKIGSQGLDGSDEGGSDGCQGRTTKETNFNLSPHQRALFVEPDEQLRETEAMDPVDQKEGSQGRISILIAKIKAHVATFRSG